MPYYTLSLLLILVLSCLVELIVQYNGYLMYTTSENVQDIWLSFHSIKKKQFYTGFKRTTTHKTIG
jgi:hypothetical protein